MHCLKKTRVNECKMSFVDRTRSEEKINILIVVHASRRYERENLKPQNCLCGRQTLSNEFYAAERNPCTDIPHLIVLTTETVTRT